MNCHNCDNEITTQEALHGQVTDTDEGPCHVECLEAGDIIIEPKLEYEIEVSPEVRREQLARYERAIAQVRGQALHRRFTRPIDPAEVGGYAKLIAQALSDLNVMGGEDFVVMAAAEFEKQPEEREPEPLKEIGGFRADDPGTSLAAAISVYEQMEGEKKEILAAVEAAGDGGMTSAEVEAAVGKAIWRRMSDLTRTGWLRREEGITRASARTGRQQSVYWLTTRAKEIRAGGR